MYGAKIRSKYLLRLNKRRAERLGKPPKLPYTISYGKQPIHLAYYRCVKGFKSARVRRLTGKYRDLTFEAFVTDR